MSTLKRICLLGTALLASITLAGCNNLASQESKKATSSSSTLSAKTVKHHKVHKKANKKKQVSASSASSNSAATNSQQNSRPNSQQATTSKSSSNSTPQQAAQGSQQNDNGQLPPSSDLHDFVNRYGESPAAYLSDHYGMSPEQAVQSVPNDMKSSGEIQDTYQLQQGQDPFQ